MKIALSSEQLRKLWRIESLIFVTFMSDGWEDKWQLLLDEAGEPFDNMDEAIAFVRADEKLSEWGTGLAPYKYAGQDTTTWDNL